MYKGKAGSVVVIEAKGGTSPLGRGYGVSQGTAEWAIRAAKATLRGSRASQAERTAARAVLEAAAKGKLEVRTVRTPHVLGKPGTAAIESVGRSNGRTARLAARLLGRGGNTRFKVASMRMRGRILRLRRSPTGIGRLARNTGIAVGLVTVVSGIANGYRYATGKISGRSAFLNTIADGGLAGAGYGVAHGVITAIGEKVSLCVRVGGGVGVMQFVFESGRDIIAVLNGDASPGELFESVCENAGRAALTGVGATIILAGFSNPGTATVLVVVAGVAFLADVAYDAIAPVFHRKRAALQTCYDRLPASFRNACPLEWIKEHRPLEKFGIVYGPILQRTPTQQRPRGVVAENQHLLRPLTVSLPRAVASACKTNLFGYPFLKRYRVMGLLLPRYGNYGGPGHTGDGAPPADRLDALFKKHDEAYASAQHQKDLILADFRLVHDLENMSAAEVGSLGNYGRWYRRCAIHVFRLKVALEFMAKGLM